jgi:hypothetical protein
MEFIRIHHCSRLPHQVRSSRPECCQPLTRAGSGGVDGSGVRILHRGSSAPHPYFNLHTVSLKTGPERRADLAGQHQLGTLHQILLRMKPLPLTVSSAAKLHGPMHIRTTHTNTAPHPGKVHGHHSTQGPASGPGAVSAATSTRSGGVVLNASSETANPATPPCKSPVTRTSPGNTFINSTGEWMGYIQKAQAAIDGTAA